MEPEELAAAGEHDLSVSVQDVFVLPGRGTVVVGVVEHGRVGADAVVGVRRDGTVIRHASVLGILVRHEDVESASAGTAVGLVLAGVGREDLRRGDVICW
jgi:elongation factor Tu